MCLPFGVIAQLGERLRGTQEVGGSIPPSSTSRFFCKETDSLGSPSSRGLGHCPFTAVTGVRIPLGTPPWTFDCLYHFDLVPIKTHFIGYVSLASLPMFIRSVSARSLRRSSCPSYLWVATASISTRTSLGSLETSTQARAGL